MKLNWSNIQRCCPVEDLYLSSVDIVSWGHGATALVCFIRKSSQTSSPPLRLARYRDNSSSPSITERRLYDNLIYTAWPCCVFSPCHNLQHFSDRAISRRNIPCDIDKMLVWEMNWPVLLHSFSYVFFWNGFLVGLHTTVLLAVLEKSKVDVWGKHSLLYVAGS